jgi:glycosyltransferase involved in cell wall biosynthesis
MKILFLNNFNYLRGGSERVMFEEMRMLQDAGHETAVFTRAYQQNQSALYERFFPDEIQRDKYSISLKGVRTLKELLYSRQARLGLQHLLEEFKPDLVHAHNIYGGLSTSVLDALKEKNVPTVMTLHDLKLLCPSYLMLNHGRVCERCKGNRFYHAVLTKCHKNSYLASAIYASESYFSHLSGKYDAVDLFIAPSLFLLNKHREFGIDANRFVHIPNPVVPADNAVYREPGGYLLYFGRISREKGLRTLIAAYTKLKTDLPLLIAGDGADRASVEKMVTRDQKEQIQFMGYLTAGPLGMAIDAARAVILPSECYENAPMAILESFSRGKPVIGARIGGIPEMIDDGVNGYLFEPGNAADLQQKLKMFLSLPADHVMEMGRAAQSKVESEYTAGSHYEQLMKAYCKAMAKSRG